MAVHELNAVQRDLLFAVGGLNDSSGQAIKSELESTQDRSLLAGRVYTNLDELVERDLVHKGSKNGRTNEYTLTEKGHEAIETRRQWEKRYLAEMS